MADTTRLFTQNALDDMGAPETSIGHHLLARGDGREERSVMCYCKTVFTGILVVLLFIPVAVRSEEASGAKAAGEKFTKGGVARQTATSTAFSPAVVEFLDRPLPSQLVTINPSDSPQVSIMWFKYENGALLFTTTTDRVKVRNMQKDPRAALIVLDPTNMYKWVIVHGKLSVDNRDPAAFYRGLAEHYLDGAALADWRKAVVMDKRTVLKLTPTRIRTMGFSQD